MTVPEVNPASLLANTFFSPYICCALLLSCMMTLFCCPLGTIVMPTLDFFVHKRTQTRTRTGMNVIMPVAMTTMHTDPELATRSAQTGKRGIRVLQALSSSSSDIPQLQDNIHAIWEVASSSISTLDNDETVSFTSDKNLIKVRDEQRRLDLLTYEIWCLFADTSSSRHIRIPLEKYWTEFFEKWGYKGEQRKDIANAMTPLLRKPWSSGRIGIDCIVQDASKLSP